MRKIITISMPVEMHEHIVRRLSKTRYASVSEYVRELIRKDDPGDGKPAQARPEDSPSHSDRGSSFVIRTANETVRLGLAQREAERDRY